MAPTLDMRAIAARIHSLVQSPNADSLETIAKRLRVSSGALWVALDGEDPHSTIEIIAAVVREYGVDPSWLVWGEYNSTTHYAALGDEDGMTAATLLALTTTTEQLTPAAAHDARAQLTQSPPAVELADVRPTRVTATDDEPADESPPRMPTSDSRAMLEASLQRRARDSNP